MPNAAASKADVGSEAGGATAVVGSAAAALLAIITDPIPCSPACAAVKAAGCALTNMVASRGSCLQSIPSVIAPLPHLNRTIVDTRCRCHRSLISNNLIEHVRNSGFEQLLCI